jgi:membrane protein
MRDRKNRLTGFIQRMYITWDSFIANDLFTYASAGAYSFLLSSLPILLMVIVILVRILNTSPEVLRSLIEANNLISNSVDLSPVFQSVRWIRSIGFFEVILGVSIFWMARRFFASIQQSMIVIYHKRGRLMSFRENIAVIVGEILLIIVISATTTFFIAGNTLFNSTFMKQIFPALFFTLFRNLFRFVPLAILFGFLFLVYLYTPKTRPQTRVSFFSALACTLSFALVQLVFTSFINMTTYNLIYGILSNVIVILLEVYFFFFLFLFFAQFQYVVQFFESFLLSRLYLLPAYDDPSLANQLQRILFCEPPFFYNRYAMRAGAGQTVFTIGDDSTELYYVCRGIVRVTMPNQIVEIGPGGIFGEFSSFIGGNRTGTAVAQTESVLLKIPERLFQETIEVDGAMSRRTLRVISDYVRKNTKTPLPEFPDV